MTSPVTVRVARRESFNAAHQLRDPHLSEAENRRLFGKCANLHGHNYVLEVVVAGPVDPAGHDDFQDVVVPVEVGAFPEEPPVLGLRQVRVAQLVRGIERFASGYSHSRRTGHNSLTSDHSSEPWRPSVSGTITITATSNAPSA